jgi:hypothetical protein
MTNFLPKRAKIWIRKSFLATLLNSENKKVVNNTNWIFLCLDCVWDHCSNSSNVSARYFNQLDPLIDRGGLARTEVKETASTWPHGPLQAGAWTVGTVGKNTSFVMIVVLGCQITIQFNISLCMCLFKRIFL